MRKIILFSAICLSFVFAKDSTDRVNKENAPGKFYEQKADSKGEKRLPPNCASEADLKAGKCEKPEGKNSSRKGKNNSKNDSKGKKRLPPNCASEADLKAGKCEKPEGKNSKEGRGNFDGNMTRKNHHQ